MMPVARRVLGESHELTLKMRWLYGISLYGNPNATLDDLRETVNMLKGLYIAACRVHGGAQPTVAGIQRSLRFARKALDARETPSRSK